MMGRTHLVLGINALWVLKLVPASLSPASGDLGSDLGLLAASAALGALLPDLDAAHSTIKSLQIVHGVRPFAVPAQLLHGMLGHRGLLHSLLGLALTLTAATPLGLWLGGWPVLALMLGYASHLLGDAATRNGIPLLFPSRRRWHLLPPPLRLVTGSQAEEVIFAALGGGALFLLLSGVNR